MKFGLIGHPIAHSLSPALFKAGYDGRYPYELIQTDDFEQAYARFLESYDGINVTAPFKELAFSKADILSEECSLIGATNLLVKTAEGIKAFNSDYLGVRLWLSEVAAISDGKEKQHRATRVSKTFRESRSSDGSSDCLAITACPSGLSQSDRRIDNNQTALVVGLGGAGKAAAVAAHSLGFDLILMNRDMSKAEAMAARLDSMTDHSNSITVRPLTEFADCFREADIIIYNIPAAIPQLAEIPAPEEGRPKHVLEANYKDPSFDKELIHRLLDNNPESSYTSGKTWLLYQAVTGYELFTGEKPDLARMSAVI